LALFGRRLSERGEGLAIPASENLHKTCRKHLQQNPGVV
jgi:hypothetical protein